MGDPRTEGTSSAVERMGPPGRAPDIGGPRGGKETQRKRHDRTPSKRNEERIPTTKGPSEKGSRPRRDEGKVDGYSETETEDSRTTNWDQLVDGRWARNRHRERSKRRQTPMKTRLGLYRNMAKGYRTRRAGSHEQRDRARIRSHPGKERQAVRTMNRTGVLRATAAG